jgi:hypothetical protein
MGEQWYRCERDCVDEEWRRDNPSMSVSCGAGCHEYNDWRWQAWARNSCVAGEYGFVDKESAMQAADRWAESQSASGG